MEAPQLRPLGVGDIVDRVFSMYRQRALLFAALAAVPYLALFLVIGGIALSLGSQLAPLAPFIEDLATPGQVPNVNFTPQVAGAVFALVVIVAD